LKWPAHGANLNYLFEALKMPKPERIIDFSANINPLGPPPLLKEQWHQLYDRISDYPDPMGFLLKKRIAEREGLLAEQVLIGNGGAEIISLIGRMLSGKRVVIVQPAFSEYEKVCRVNGCSIEYHQLKPDHWEWADEGLDRKLEHADAMFFCNPSNPTGVYYPKTVVLHLLEKCATNNCLLIVDEAFYDFVPTYESIVEYMKDFANLLVIRSMTKMFAIPGIRLGYLLGDPTMIKEIGKFQPEWSINALALMVGEWCLSSENHITKTIKLIEAEKARLTDFYVAENFLVSPSSTNFYLLRDPSLGDQFPFYQFLITQGMIPRHTMNFVGLEGTWMRFAIKSPDANDQLVGAIVAWRNL
jgi:threonine-phosphate decarboxylase